MKSSSPLELREDPSQGVQVAGLTKVTVEKADDIMVLHPCDKAQGNMRNRFYYKKATSEGKQTARVQMKHPRDLML